MKRILYFIIFQVLLQTSFAQETTEQQLENLADLTETEPEDDAFLQQYEYYSRNKLNINEATAEDLQVFKFLTDLQINNLMQYKKLLGSLINIYELQSVPAWDVATIKRLLPFITVSTQFTLSKNFFSRFSGGEHVILSRASQVLEEAKGYDTTLNTHYLGSRQKLFLRYKYQYKNLLQYGFVADKDAGEQFFKGAQSKGFDFYSAHLFARNLGIVKAIALGDFTVNMGQGLIQWQSLAFKKSAVTMAIKRQSPVLRPYNSAGEFYFNRGAGITVGLGRVEATAFASVRDISASTGLDTLNNEELFSSFLTSGLYRTPNEIKNKNSTQQTSFGGNVSFNSTNFKVGINAIHYKFSKVLQKRDDPYNAFAITGDNWTNFSADYSFTYKNLHFFGEAAADKNMNKAFINGMLISPDPKVDVSILYRNISEKYGAVYGNAFTENVFPTNEKGIYAGISIRPLLGIRLDGYVDFYKFPWLKYRTDAPSAGNDYLVQLTYTPSKKFEIYTRYRTEAKEINESNNTTVTNFLVKKPRHNFRIHAVYSPIKVLSLRTRGEMLWYDKESINKEKGVLIYTEGVYKPGFKLSTSARLQYFNTDSYNSRLYAYESDVLYSYSIPAFYDEGLRYYINLNYDITKQLTFWLRWAQTIYSDRDSIGSGLEEIKGNKRTEVKFQIRMIF